MPTKDRRVHASYGSTEIVRYDRAGKWYVEYTYSDGSKGRSPLGVDAAARLAATYATTVTFNLPGGSTFDRKVLSMGRKAA